tara:strand:- start:3480 stop:3740 length:261 start_codon:yes stop_codon:yes gene_type:complete
MNDLKSYKAFMVKVAEEHQQLNEALAKEAKEEALRFKTASWNDGDWEQYWDDQEWMALPQEEKDARQLAYESLFEQETAKDSDVPF